MEESNPRVKHFAVSAAFFCVWFIVFVLSFPFIEKIFSNPGQYVGSALSPEDFQFAVAAISLLISGVLIAYISYLLMASKTRIGALALKETSWLAQSREQFRRLYDGAPIPYVTLNGKGEIRDPNKAALRFFGVVPEEISGKNLFAFCAAEDEQLAQTLYSYFKVSKPVDRAEVRFITKRGDVKWVSLSVFEMGTALEGGRMALASLFDITEEKLLDQAKTEFVSLASHQLRTPSATIKWYTEMLLSGDIGTLTDKQQDYVRRLYGVNEDMIDLVDTLLNVSRIELGKLPIDRKKTNVQELCESILTELEPQLQKKQLVIVREYADALANIENDPKLLRIVIHNLISNAMKYTPDGGTITISLSDKGGGSITVTDTGYGIPENVQDKVFQKLFRADNVRSLASSQGTGLGLYLVKSIMEALGGDIRFVSRENEGSSFTIEL